MSYMDKLVWRQEDALLLSASECEAVRLKPPAAPEDDVWRLNCVSEVVPGLYLTCKEQMADKAACAKRGIPLVIDLCATGTTAPYTVMQVGDDGDGGKTQCSCLTRDAFFRQLDAHTASPTCTSPGKLFVRSVAAVDLPTYDMSQHLPELCAMLELVAVNRELVERAGRGGEAAAAPARMLPAASVHCLLGVSRSATVVIAYLMKRVRLSCDNALGFVRSRRPAVNPNPGFLQQLLMWERMSCMLLVDAWTADLLAVELRHHRNLTRMWPSFVTQLVTSGHCGGERRHVGDLLWAVGASSDELRCVYTALQTCLVTGITGELFVDVPSFFDNACTILASIDDGCPALWQHALSEQEWASAGTPSVVCSDGLVGDMCVAACEGRGVNDAAEVVSVVVRLLTASCHACSGSVLKPRAYDAAAVGVSVPSCLCCSFPLLLLLAPFADGLLPSGALCELRCAVDEAALMSERDDKVVALAERVLCTFISVLCVDVDAEPPSDADVGEKDGGAAASDATCKTAGSTVTTYDTMLAPLRTHLRSDMEVLTYLGCARGTLHSIAAVLERQLATVEHAGLGRVLACKAAAGVIAFRLVLDAAVAFAHRACVHAALSHAVRARAEQRLSIAELQTALDAIAVTYKRRYATPLSLTPYVARLLLCFDEEVVPRCGAVAAHFACNVAALQ